VITVNNLTLNGSSIRDGQSSAENWTLNGSLLVTGVGGNLACQETFHLNSVISGSGPLYIADFGNTDVGRVVNIGSALNTYNGNIAMMGSAANRSRLTFIDNSLMNFTIGASGVNNAITGNGTLNLNGDFAINLSGAGDTIGNSWTLVNNASLTETYGATFTVSGWTDAGGNLWQTFANGVLYEFSEGTGMLTVIPEPSSAGLLVLAGVVLGLRRSRASR
jgi:hypothetical protein